ncbi:MAG: hypothetical protein JNK94_05285 [Hyphomonadaceae bacterium]|mgnify:CR=1 FL=1|nr:hypothetical protein [Hyphomonadaceae bacterium]
MNDDRFMAELLGAAPRKPDSGFRLDVFARIAERARRRRSWERAGTKVAAFTAVGFAVPVLQMAGLSPVVLTPVLMALAALAAAGAFAWVMIAGAPKRVLARSLGLAR